MPTVGSTRTLRCVDLAGKEFQFKTFWQWSLLHSMIFIGNSEAFVQSTSLPLSFRLNFFSYKIWFSFGAWQPEAWNVRVNRFWAKREQIETVLRHSTESQDQNLAWTVFDVLDWLDSGYCTGLLFLEAGDAVGGLIAAIIWDKYSVCPAIRHVCTRCCSKLPHMIHMCGNLYWARVIIINSRPDEIAELEARMSQMTYAMDSPSLWQ